MVTLEAPVEVSMVPLPSAAKVLTTQLEGKPLIGTGGPKKQATSNAQPPGALAQSASEVQVIDGSLTQWRVAAGPLVQSRGPVPLLAVSVIPSAESKIEVAFSGTMDAGMLSMPPPM